MLTTAVLLLLLLLLQMVEADAAILLHHCICAASATGQEPQLVMVGDPKQLAAVVKSLHAEHKGYSRSLFERLQQRGSHSPMLLNTQYRCRPEISLWPRQRFYGGQLQDGPNVLDPSYSAALLQPLASGKRGSGSSAAAAPTVPDPSYSAMLLQPLASGSSRSEAAGLPCFKPFEVIDVRGSFEEQGSHDMGSVAGTVSSFSYSNPMEVDTVMWRLKQLLQQVVAARAAAAAAGAQPVTVGIITGYTRQVAAILQQCINLAVDGSRTAASSNSGSSSSNTGSSSSSSSSSKDGGGSVTIGPLLVDVRSVNSFQGQERDVIIFSAVRSNDKSGRPAMGFTGEPRRTNVALTRARHMLVVVCNARTVSTDATWAGLLASAEGRGMMRVLDCADKAAAESPQNADCGDLLVKLRGRQQQWQNQHMPASVKWQYNGTGHAWQVSVICGCGRWVRRHHWLDQLWRAAWCVKPYV
jgi:hypothetical protein